MITQEYLKSIVYYNEISGHFYKLKNNNIVNTKDKDGYLVLRIDKKIYKVHRLAFLYKTGEFPKETVDHIDMDKANNAWGNLRDVSMSKNKMNMKSPRKDNATGYLGVSFYRAGNKYAAGIKVNGIRKHIGYFEAPELAHKAYLKAKSELHVF